MFETGENGFRITGDGGSEEFLVRGINLGMAESGHFPGEAAISRETYDRWIASIGELNANAIRTYTIHPPAFYEALESYNRNAEDPVYLFQARCVEERTISPLREDEDVPVVEMTDELVSSSEMFVLVEWMDREFGVPLSQLEVLDADHDTREAVADWHYWNGDGGRLG